MAEHATMEGLLERLDELGIAHHTYQHVPVFTVDESRSVCAHMPGGHTKNLFLKDRKGKLWLVVTCESVPVDLNRLASQLQAGRFSFASPELLRDTLGVQPGSVTPFAIINDTQGIVQLALDEAMLRLDPLNFHPLRNDRTTAISARDLLKFARATGHEPLITSIPERSRGEGK